MACHGGQHGTRAPLTLGLAALLCVGACTSRELERGDALLGQGRYDEAIAVWRRALAAHPRELKPLIRIATAQARQGKLGDAEATLLRGVELAPSSPRMRQNLALVYLKQKKLDKALDTFHQVLELQDTYPSTHYYIGLIHEMRGDEATARKRYVQEVNHGACLGAWDRLWELNRKTRPRPQHGRTIVILSIALLALGACAYALRLYLEARHGWGPSELGVD